MMNLRPFEIALIGTFAALAIGGLIFIAVYESENSQEESLFGESVIIWGPFESSVFSQLISDTSSTNRSFDALSYEQIDPRDYEDRLLGAIAQGKSPDLVILPHTSLVSMRPILTPISYETYPVGDFKGQYIDGAEIFMMSDGIYGIPFAVDPLVMYWNRDIFATAGVASPPSTWETLTLETTPKMVVRNPQLEITRSAVAFGEYANVAHAKEIISLLLLQTGSKIVDEQGGAYSITLNRSMGTGLPTGGAALNFYTQFASPSSPTYSWNRSQGLDRGKFLGGSLAMYFGFGSEYEKLRRGNPNLNFDITNVPQGSGAKTFRNYGTFYAFAIPRESENVSGAYLAALELARAGASKIVIEKLDLAPVHRSLIEEGSTDPYRSVLNRSALIAHGWLDPRPEESGDIFRTMVESITSGNERTASAVDDAVRQLELLFK